MNSVIKPFVKWAGGKGSLLPQLSIYYPDELKHGNVDTYVEPFVGGGAVLIDILQKYSFKHVYAFDINRELINSYNVIKYNVNELIIKLNQLQTEYLELNSNDRTNYYYNIRNTYNTMDLPEESLSVDKAALFIFLNRTCFNGLYRVNKSGKFNVPIGSYKNPTICDKENLKALSKLIQNVEFKYGDYTESQNYIDNSTFVYFDPPYRPLNITSAFTSYAKEDFNDENQKELAKYYYELDKRDSLLMLSNSNPKNTNENDTFFDEIYSDFNINTVYAKRMINSNSTKRGAISELLITNY